MPQPSDLDTFLQKIMHINVLRMGGASAAIIGDSGADKDVVNNLKRSTIAFASEYRKSPADQDRLQRLSDEVGGSLRILQLTNTLSEERAGELMEQLDTLMGHA